MEGQALAAGAQMEVRDGWNVAVAYPGAATNPPVAWADVSHLRKLEVTGPHELAFGHRGADRRRVVVPGHARAHTGHRVAPRSTPSRSPRRSPP